MIDCKRAPVRAWRLAALAHFPVCLTFAVPCAPTRTAVVATPGSGAPGIGGARGAGGDQTGKGGGGAGGGGAGGARPALAEATRGRGGANDSAGSGGSGQAAGTSGGGGQAGAPTGVAGQPGSAAGRGGQSGGGERAGTRRAIGTGGQSGSGGQAGGAGGRRRTRRRAAGPAAARPAVRARSGARGAARLDDYIRDGPGRAGRTRHRRRRLRHDSERRRNARLRHEASRQLRQEQALLVGLRVSLERRHPRTSIPAGSNGYNMAHFGLQKLSNNGAIFVAPQGLGNGWANSGGQDLKFVDDMVKLIEDNYCVDTTRALRQRFQLRRRHELRDRVRPGEGLPWRPRSTTARS